MGLGCGDAFPRALWLRCGAEPSPAPPGPPALPAARPPGRQKGRIHSRGSAQPRPARPAAAPWGRPNKGAVRGSVLELLRDGRDLLHAVLVSRQVALEGLVLSDERFDVGQRGGLVILLLQHRLFACRTGTPLNPQLEALPALRPPTPLRSRPAAPQRSQGVFLPPFLPTETRRRAAPARFPASVFPPSPSVRTAQGRDYRVLHGGAAAAHGGTDSWRLPAFPNASPAAPSPSVSSPVGKKSAAGSRAASKLRPAPFRPQRSPARPLPAPGRGTFSPGLVDGGFLPELLSQVVEALQAPDLVQQPLLVAFLRLLQVLPARVDVLRAQSSVGSGCRTAPGGETFGEGQKRSPSPKPSSFWLSLHPASP